MQIAEPKGAWWSVTRAPGYAAALLGRSMLALNAVDPVARLAHRPDAGIAR